MIAEVGARVSKRLGVHEQVRSVYWRLRLARSGWRCRTAMGTARAEFVTKSRSEYERATTFLGEHHVVERLLDDLRSDDVFWDVGATVGTYACLATSVLPGGSVVGIEPEPTNANRLRQNLRLNAPTNRWSVLEVALGDADGRARLASERVEAGAGHHRVVEEGGSEVLRRRGTSLVDEGTPAPDVMKIDVQGAELDVLRGMGTVLGDVRQLYVEVHIEKCKRYGATSEEVEAFLSEAGFDVQSLGEPNWDRDGVYHIRATR